MKYIPNLAVLTSEHLLWYTCTWSRFMAWYIICVFNYCAVLWQITLPHYHNSFNSFIKSNFTVHMQIYTYVYIYIITQVIKCMHKITNTFQFKHHMIKHTCIKFKHHDLKQDWFKNIMVSSRFISNGKTSKSACAYMHTQAHTHAHTHTHSSGASLPHVCMCVYTCV